MTINYEINSIADFERILDEDPAVRERIRRRLLTDEERQLPSLVAQLTANLSALTQTVADGFAQVQAQFQEVNSQFQEVHSQFQEVNARLDQAATERAEMRQDIKALQDGQAEMRQDIKALQDGQNHLRGEVLEQTAARRLLPRLAQELQLRRPRVIHSAIVALPEDLADTLENAVRQGIIGSDAADAVTYADLIVQGISKSDGTPVYVLAEISGVLNRQDVARALARAATLELATGQRTLAAAAAITVPAPQSAQAAAAGVTLFRLD